MELGDYLRLLRKYRASIIALLFAGVLGGGAVSWAATPTYTSTAELFLTVQSANSAGDLAQGSSYTERQVLSFAEVAVSQMVLGPVIEKLGLTETPEDLAERMTLSVPPSTATLDIAVVDTDAVRAADTANLVAERLVQAVADLAPRDATREATTEAHVITRATPATSWTTPNVARNLLLGTLLGGLLGLGQALTRHMLDQKVRSIEDLAGVTDVPVVGTITFDPTAPTHPLVVVEDPHSPRAEDFRRLRTAVQFLGVGNRGPSIAVSSAIAGEGKTTTAVNLALALAATGKRVLLMDADLRLPRVASRLDLPGDVGLTTILLGEACLKDTVLRAGGHLDVLPAGLVPPNPSELLGSDAMRAVMASVNEAYEYVVIDSAPLVPVADTAVLSSMTGGVLLVVASGFVDGTQVQQAVEAVRAADGEVIGVVLNKVTKLEAAYRGTYRYGQAGPDQG